MKTALERKNEMKEHIKRLNADYVQSEIEKIWSEIQATINGGDVDFWYTFYWDEGDYSKVIEYFESIDIHFGSPTGPYHGSQTSFNVDIRTMFEESKGE